VTGDFLFILHGILRNSNLKEFLGLNLLKPEYSMHVLNLKMAKTRAKGYFWLFSVVIG